MNQSDLYEHIGALIKQRRRNLKITQTTLAKQMNVSRAALANIETGRQNLSVYQLYTLARALEMPPIDFLPSPSSLSKKSETALLPFPTGLKSQQKEQIARLFEDGQTNAT